MQVGHYWSLAGRNVRDTRIMFNLTSYVQTATIKQSRSIELINNQAIDCAWNESILWTLHSPQFMDFTNWSSTAYPCPCVRVWHHQFCQWHASLVSRTVCEPLDIGRQMALVRHSIMDKRPLIGCNHSTHACLRLHASICIFAKIDVIPISCCHDRQRR